jgi:hypothetical protein
MYKLFNYIGIMCLVYHIIYPDHSYLIALSAIIFTFQHKKTKKDIETIKGDIRLYLIATLNITFMVLIVIIASTNDKFEIITYLSYGILLRAC